MELGAEAAAGARGASSREMRVVSLAACTRGWANYTNPLPPSAKKKEQEKQHKPEKRKMKGEIESQSGDSGA